MIQNCWPIIAAVVLVGCSGHEKPPQAETTSPQTSTVRRLRQAAVAGMFYPQHKDELDETIDRLLAEVEPAAVARLRAVVCPHAGYKYSGRTAAFAYKLLQGRDITTVFVLAPSHCAKFEGASIADVDAYETPLGTVSLSPVAKELAKIPPFAQNPPCDVNRPAWWRRAPKDIPPFGEDTPHTWEHSLEVQLPFLQKTLGDFTLVPVVFGQVDSQAVARVLASRIDEKTLLVASSDLSHFHSCDKAVQLDASCTRAICDLDIEWMEGEEACGKLPILTLMHIAREKGWKTRLLDYRNSGDVTGDKSSVVGYAAIAFFEPDEGGEPGTETTPSGLTAQDGKLLVELAAKTVREVVTRGREPEVDPAGLPESLHCRRACFVTLTKDGKLRGCIGSLFPSEPLYRAVVRRARSAATDDPRFPPVEPKELDQIQLEVSVLSVPKRLEFQSPEDLLKKLRPEVDGVLLRIGRRQATYLPQVWEKIPDAKRFLNQLSGKAGLWPDAWKSPDAMVLTYQVEAFEQSEK